MEKLVTVLKAFPFEERPYQDKNGNPQVFASRKFILSDGIDSFVAEMQGDLARANKDMQYDLSQAHSAQLQITVHPWKDAQGVDRYSNEIKIIKLS